VKVQEESSESFHVGLNEAHLGRNSLFESNLVTLGGGLARENIHVFLDEEGSECQLRGLFLSNGKRHADTQVFVDHRKPFTKSSQLYKGLLDDASSTIFAGKIHVAEDAQKIEAYQTNKNLLLSDEASVKSKPELAIYADDVICSHGSATGQVDSRMLFYLRSRGINESLAKKILAHGFARDVIEQIPVAAVRDKLEELLVKRFEEGRHENA